MERPNTHILDLIAGVLLIIGGLNWLLVGLFSFNLVANALYLDGLVRLVYILVGIAAIYTLVRIPSLYHIGGRASVPPTTPHSVP